MTNLRDRNQKEIQAKLQKEMEKQGFDGLLLTDFGAIYYATGYASKFQYLAGVPGNTMAVVPAKGECILILSEFEMQSPLVYCKDIKIETINSPVFIDELESMVSSKPEKPDSNAGFARALEIICSGRPNAKIGIQMNHMTVTPMNFLKDHAGEATITDCSDLLNRVRAVKTDWEISVLREAAQMSEKTLYDFMKHEYRVGMTQAEYLNLMTRKSYENSVYVTDYIDMNAYGTHFSPSFFGIDRPSKEGDLIRYDGGITYMGYLTDFARLFCIGKPSDRAKKIYAAEVAGYETVMSMIGPGVPMADVFKKAQEAVRENGIPNYLRGFVGHSIGCNVFAEEWPYISPSSQEVFTPGMVLSIELPYYNPNLGGLNIEDTVVITETGYEKFTDCPREIIEI
ncbi:Xaa-Pro peptidase family protein [Ruminococcus sp. CLA-AA-H200]|uniref:Xaa-Pro peptidase family protein n=1 Tax=Ruminococcus turbiniformis TaxID=2881258 RepID=A0ABS8G340_9FIRM|nr:Xaa-Pro peptidase family protein [Ruminococcus turbiniformis]MCC2256299.1 Xaa-Pro peptidase family protein [Ruminococcus turbiniformis]